MICKVTLNNKVYEVEVDEDSAMLIDEYEAKAPVAKEEKPAAATPQPQEQPKSSVSVASGTVVSSPLPGTVVNIKVKEGQSVKKGEVLVIVEAMKMENEIMAPQDGQIKQVAVKVGDKVETGAALIVM